MASSVDIVAVMNAQEHKVVSDTFISGELVVQVKF